MQHRGCSLSASIRRRLPRTPRQSVHRLWLRRRPPPFPDQSDARSSVRRNHGCQPVITGVGPCRAWTVEPQSTSRSGRSSIVLHDAATGRPCSRPEVRLEAHGCTAGAARATLQGTAGEQVPCSACGGSVARRPPRAPAPRRTRALRNRPTQGAITNDAPLAVGPSRRGGARSQPSTSSEPPRVRRRPGASSTPAPTMRRGCTRLGARHRETAWLGHRVGSLRPAPVPSSTRCRTAHA